MLAPERGLGWQVDSNRRREGECLQVIMVSECVEGGARGTALACLGGEESVGIVGKVFCVHD
jgi:hypothetical protein